SKSPKTKRPGSTPDFARSYELIFMPLSASAIVEMAESSRILLTACQKSTPKFKKFGERKRVSAPSRLGAPVAQWKERLAANREVTRSNRVGGTNFKINALMISLFCEVYSNMGFCSRGS